MLKTNLPLQVSRLNGAAIAAPRQIWLAGLGASVVARDWLQVAGNRFQTLVKEGTVVESRAVRFVGDRIESSIALADSLWRQTRRVAESTVKQTAGAATEVARAVLPKSLPAFDLASMIKVQKPAAKASKRTTKAAKAPRRGAKVARKSKRA
jgi:hypothetical protein